MITVPKIEKWDDVKGTDDSKNDHLQAFVESINDSYAILQLVHTDDTLYERFESYASLQHQGKEPDPDHYEVVYHGALSPAPATQEDVMVQLESFWVKFNEDRPKDFTGHSLSVSDIVAFKIAGEVSYHYVDRIGFKELDNFALKENYLKNAEMALEDDYGMIDGIVNNGRKEEPAQERRSIFDDLKAFSNTEPQERIKPPSRQAEIDGR